jgi:glycosyltransferase involved in cell wall biosynthesis
MLLGLAEPLRAALGRPIVCTLQGEDFFLDGLTEPYKTRALDLIRGLVRDVNHFIAVSDYYAVYMKDYLHIPSDRISVVPLGVNLKGFEKRASTSDDVFRIGYFARVAPEKGLHLLARAFLRLRRRAGGRRVKLEAAGYLAPAHEAYLGEVRRTLAEGAALDDFRYRGAVNRDGKVSFFQDVDVLSVPTLFDDSKGLPLLEAMASGVPVVQPRRGSFTEIVERTGGGLLVKPDDVESLADGLHTVLRDASLRHQLGRRGQEGVRAHHTIQRSADKLLAVYDRIVSGRELRVQPEGRAYTTH